MPLLQVLYGNEPLQTVVMDETTCTIGRGEDADVVIDDRTVSRLHCELRANDEGYVLRNLGSRTGTFLNGMRVSEAVIRPGDEVQLGRHTIVFDPQTRAPRHSFAPRAVADPHSGTLSASPESSCGCARR
jgi:pSer/pThr/pTyr-binding forkhead associated (FHA) protein